MSAFIDLTGRRFGRLLVMQATSKRSSQGDIYWKCVCDCGKSVVVNGKSLRSSGQKSCGCLHVNGRIVNIIEEHMTVARTGYLEFGEE